MGRKRGLIVVGVLVSTMVLGIIGIDAFAKIAQSTGSVVRVIDGDTLVAMIDGHETKVRLLNVDTPETKDPNQEPECLGQEATQFLSERLPAGTEIDLKYDKDRTDPYGRTLAAVYEAESLVNAEIARKRLGAAVLFEPNDKYYDEVLAAQKAAQDAAVGLYDPEITCTLPAEVDRVIQVLQETSEQMPADTSAAAAAVGSASAAVALGEALEAALKAIDNASHDEVRSASIRRRSFVGEGLGILGGGGTAVPGEGVGDPPVCPALPLRFLVVPVGAVGQLAAAAGGSSVA